MHSYASKKLLKTLLAPNLSFLALSLYLVNLSGYKTKYDLGKLNLPWKRQKMRIWEVFSIFEFYFILVLKLLRHLCRVKLKVINFGSKLELKISLKLLIKSRGCLLLDWWRLRIILCYSWYCKNNFEISFLIIIWFKQKINNYEIIMSDRDNMW